MSFSSYNPSYSAISEAYRKIFENSDGRLYLYHCTDTNPADIVKNGFDSHSDSANGFTVENQFEELYDRYLPVNPCFVSKGRWDSDSKYVLKIDVTGLELFPDFGHLLDVGAYYEEPDADGDVLFWWKGRDWDFLESKFNGLKKYLDNSGGYLNSADFDGNMSLSLIGTACIDGDELSPDRIVEVNGEKFDYGKLAESVQFNTESASSSSLNESVYDDYDVDLMNIIDEFKDDMERGIKTKRWNLINPNQYAYALSKFVKEGPELFSFPDSVLDGWLRIVVENTKEIEAIGVLDGRDELNGGSVIDHYLIEEVFKDEFDKEYARLKPYSERDKMGIAWLRANAAYGALEDVGFYDWAVLPDGKPADSDNGVAGVMEILSELEWDSSASDKIVAINRCLDVFHRRSDWASAFIEGGSESLYRISNVRNSFYQNAPNIEESSQPNAKMLENVDAKRKREAFVGGLEAVNGELMMTDELVSKVFPEDVRKMFEFIAGRTEGLTEASDCVKIRLYLLSKSRNGFSRGMSESIKSKSSVFANENFGASAGKLYLDCSHSNECVGSIVITDRKTVECIKRKMFGGSFEQMELF